ncbi:MAG TPA: hypothetical protein VI035_05150 [Solirubrobacterales bacterium]
MGRVRHALPSLAAAGVVGACLIALAGCGGGGDDSPTAASATVRQITTPGQFNPGTRSTPNAPPSDDGTPTGPATPGGGSGGAQPVLQELVPFRACLSRHGVDPEQFRAGFRWRQQRDPAEIRRQIQAGVACIPELPPRLREAAERLKRRYEQRTG